MGSAVIHRTDCTAHRSVRFATQPDALLPHLNTMQQWRRFGARRRTVMTIVAAVMLGAISLYMIQQVQDLTS